MALLRPMNVRKLAESVNRHFFPQMHQYIYPNFIQNVTISFKNTKLSLEVLNDIFNRRCGYTSLGKTEVIN